MKQSIYITMFGILISAFNAATAAESTYFQNLKGLVAKARHVKHSPAKNTPDLLLLDPKTGAGGVRFGMNMDEVIKIWGTPHAVMMNPHTRDSWNGMKVTLYMGASRFVFEADKLVGISIHSASLPQAKFANGIGFHSSLEEIVKAFGEPGGRMGERFPEYIIEGTKIRIQMVDPKYKRSNKDKKSIAVSLTKQ